MIEGTKVTIVYFDEIVAIDNYGFLAKSKDGTTEVTVNFSECAKAYNPDQKCVGWRDAFANPRYFEFPGERAVFVIFGKRNGLFARWRDHADYMKFHKFQLAIVDAGWGTFDRG